MFTEGNIPDKITGRFELKAGRDYLCIKDYWPRADFLEFKEGEIYKCFENCVMGVWLFKDPWKYFVELP